MHQQNHSSPGHESGSAFWFILLAIALLVALTVTITKSGENTEQTGQRDRDRIQASDILRQAKSIEQAVQNMRLAGVAENDISFENSFVSGYDNNNCEAGASCHIFTPDGAGLAYKLPSDDWLETPESPLKDLYGEWYFFATACIPGVGTGGAVCDDAASKTELIVALPWIKESLCIELNRLAGVENQTNPVAPPALAASAFTATLDKFTGVFSTNSTIDNGDEAFTDRATGCFEGDTDPSGGFHFYHVLIAR